MAITERHAREILQKQYDRQNEFVKNTYDRIAFFVPKGMKDTIKEVAKSKGYASVNAYINAVIAADMASVAEPPTADPFPDNSRATNSRSVPG